MKKRRTPRSSEGRSESPKDLEERLARTHEQAEKVLATFPDSLMGIPRPMALLMISGFAALVRDGVKDEELRRETETIEAVCFEAALMDVLRPRKEEPAAAGRPAAKVPPVNVTWPEAWLKKYGGKDVRPA